MKWNLILTTCLFLSLQLTLHAQIIVNPQGLEFSATQLPSFHIYSDSNSLIIEHDSVPKAMVLEYTGGHNAVLELEGVKAQIIEFLLNDTTGMIVMQDDLSGFAPLDTTLNGLVPIGKEGIGLLVKDTVHFYVDSLGALTNKITFTQRGNVIKDLNSGRSGENQAIELKDDGILAFTRGDTLMAGISTIGVSSTSFSVPEADRMIVLADHLTGIVPYDSTQTGIVPLTNSGMAFLAGQDSVSFAIDSLGPLTNKITFTQRGNVIKDLNSGRSGDDRAIELKDDGILAFTRGDSLMASIDTSELNIKRIRFGILKDLEKIYRLEPSLAGLEVVESKDTLVCLVARFDSTGIYTSNRLSFPDSNSIRHISGGFEFYQKDSLLMQFHRIGGLSTFDIGTLNYNGKTINLNPPGVGNTFVGTDAGKNNTPVGVFEGQNNTAFGSEAFLSNTTGYESTAVGSNALRSNSTGTANVALGRSALLNNTTGSFNIGVGRFALFNNTTGQRNTSLGESASFQSNGSFNTSVGYAALHADISGTGNTAIGYEADVTSGNLNNATAIGFQAKVATSNSLVLGGTGSNAVKVGIGTDSPTEELHVVGNICYTGSSTSCSDRRYKQNIQVIPDALSKLNEVNGVYYDWRQAEFPKMKFSKEQQIGVIAQEVEQVFPALVQTNEEGYKSVDYVKLTPILLEAVKELSKQNEEQAAALLRLKTQHEVMQAQLTEMAELRSMLLEMKEDMGESRDTE